MGIEDGELDGILGEAFKNTAGDGVLSTIERLHGAGSSILLREAEEDASPVMLRRSEDGAAKDDSRYLVFGEIARGGIGVVYKGRDRDLNRDVALKVLRPEYANRNDVVQRFIEEAQVGGQLQHPGIVPIYGLGLQEDGRPSFAMKLINGQTLAELLDSNPKGVDLLAVFEQVAQTMAYAHSRNVIHRDIKPANIMIGAFGEVQIVDWGFAKVLGQAEVQRAPDRTLIATVRSGPVGSQSIAGSVMGTPAYMPPEQAMGRIEDLDERSDVFALGAVLCEILTGKAPYTGEPKDQLIAASQCRLDPALERLDAAEAADELKQLVRDCLEPLSGDRPGSARVVAERLSTHFASVEDRARQAELDAVTAEAEMTSAQHARRRAFALAAVALLAILAGGSGYLVWKGERDGREARAAPLIAQALREATGYEGEQDWSAAVAAAQRAVDTAKSEGVEDDAGAAELLERLKRKQVAVENAARIEAEDDALLAELEEIRGRLGSAAVGSYALRNAHAQAAVDSAVGLTSADEHRDIDATYTKAFEDRFGTVASSERRLRASRHAVAFAANLDFWSWLRRTKTALHGSDWKTPHRIAREVDPENLKVRDALVDKDEEALLETAKGTADPIPAALAVQVGRVLNALGRGAEALRFLKELSRRHPDDFWLHMRLGYVARAQDDEELATRHYGAAIALRPGHASAWMQLTNALRGGGDVEGAVAACQKAISLAPRSVLPHNMLGVLLCDDLERYDEAIDAFQRAVSLAPEYLLPLNNIGVALRKKGEFDAAIAQHRKVIEMDDECADGHAALGMALASKGDREGAIAAYLRALDLDPTDAYTWSNYGAELSEMGEHQRAMEALRKAVKHGPKLAAIHQNLSETLQQLGRLDEALDAADRALALQPKNPSFHATRGGTLMGLVRLDEAVAEYKKAIALSPRVARFHANLADALWRKRDLDAALPPAQEAVEIDPQFVWGWRILGVVYIYRRELNKAFPALEKALELEPNNGTVWADLGAAHALAGNLDESERARRKALEVEPEQAMNHYNLGSFLLQYRSAPAEALPHLEKAVELDPRHPESWCNLGHCLKALDRWTEAVDALRRGHALGSARPGWGYPSARWVLHALLQAKQEPSSSEEAISFAREMIFNQWDYARALAYYRKAFELDPAIQSDPRNGHRYNAACAAAREGEDAQALAWLRADLDLWTQRVDADPAEVVKTIAHWKKDTDLISVRDRKILPEGFQKLWADVDALLERAKEASK